MKDVSIDKANVLPSTTFSVEPNRIAMRELSKSAYYLYMFFMQNQDCYNFTLCRTHVLNVTGLSKSAYHVAKQELIDKRYLIECDDGYEFHESPLTNA